MKKEKIVLLCLLLCLTLAGCTSLNSSPAREQDFQLTLIHLNDTHSHLEPSQIKIMFPVEQGETLRVQTGGVTRLTSEIATIKQENEAALFVHAGDMVQGTLYYMLYNGEASLDFFEDMGLDAMVTGNHEYDRGPEALAEFIKQADFPILAANVDTTNEPLLKDTIVPYVIKQFGEERVAIIGLVTENVPNVSNPGKNLIFHDEATTAQKLIDALEQQGINKIVILTHMGLGNDINLAKTLNGADIIVGGHSHSLLGNFQQFGLPAEGEYPTVIKTEAGETVLVVQAWYYGKVLGVLDVAFDNMGSISTYTGRPVMVLSDAIMDKEQQPIEGEKLQHLTRAMNADPGLEIISADQTAAVKLAEFKRAVTTFEEQVVGKASGDFRHVRVPTPEYPGGSMVAPLFCDAMLWKTRKAGMEVDMAIQNGGGQRTDITAGDITIADVYTLLPFKTTLVVLKLTGAQIKETLEGALSNIFDEGNSDGAFPYGSGLRYFIEKGNAKGQRVTRIEVLTKSGSWEALQADKSYLVVTNSYIAGGKDGYAPFAKAAPQTDTGFTDAEVFMEYVRELGTIDAPQQSVFFSE